jgi:hypothetical protein
LDAERAAALERARAEEEKKKAEFAAKAPATIGSIEVRDDLEFASFSVNLTVVVADWREKGIRN